ncbi:ammonia channel protein [Caldimicrobium thiodismutans]|uniref:Ammonium transporter n=1 Tax=Caldimicrobium thiodismutans TaxID=1653476 RepID=A0A0U5AFT0_9BACT|nr:ammonium transporter [Caldimicrobium thiodismutans]BAU22860.1 ammonia channel protein [Caldimicrobium thiodismutans]
MPNPQELLKFDTGDTAWLLISTALVMMMTLPGLALFYGGLSKRKDALNTMAMSFVTYCLISVFWVVYGYSLAFGHDIFGLIGGFEKIFFKSITLTSSNEGAKTVPEFIFAMFQLTFAAITVALVSGAYIERIKFSIWITFSLLWFTMVYLPVAHWIWGGGFLAKMGVVDFAGGIVVHTTAGISALIGALILKARNDTTLIPHNLTLVVLGTGLLWFGWFGFNAGSALSAKELATIAFVNTNTAAASASLIWCIAEWLIFKKPTILGLASGTIAGLATITPAAGYVNVYGALIIGVIAGLVCFISIAFVKGKLNYDDTLDAFGIHGVGGIIGSLSVGFFADPSINQIAGLFYGSAAQLWLQLLGIGIIIFYSAMVTALIFLFLKIIFKNLRVNPEDELVGLDETQHGERAYNLHI